MTQNEIMDFIKSNNRVALDLGCGLSKKQGYIGVDKLPLPGVDYVINIENGFSIFPDNSVDEIYTSNFLEHIDDLELLMKECHRIIKPLGTFEIFVPHYSNPWFYSDYTHKRFFGLYTFLYFSDGNYKYKRKVPNFYNDFKFLILDQKLIFKSPPFYFRNLFRRILQKIFNSSIFMQELYEDIFCYLFACQEVYAKLMPKK